MHQKFKPVLYARFRNGEIDWGEDCVSSDNACADGYIEHQSDDEFYESVPLYSADTVRALQLEAIRKTIEECSLVNLSQAEIEAIKRLDEVFQDGEGYDVDKDMMKNLAHLGVIRHIGAARYEFTVIGNQILNRLLYIGGFNPEEILKGLTP